MATNSDNSGRETRREKPFTLPNIRSAAARQVSYGEPRRFFVEGRETAERAGIEIDIETDSEFPLAGTGPALFVGEAVIVDGIRVGERHYRFFAPLSLALTRGAPLALGRAGSGIPTRGKRSRVRLRWSEAKDTRD